MIFNDEKERKIFKKILDEYALKETFFTEEKYEMFNRCKNDILKCSDDFSGVSISESSGRTIIESAIITLTGKVIKIDNPKLFKEIIVKSDIVELSQKTNGNVEILIEYKNVNIPVKRVSK